MKTMKGMKIKGNTNGSKKKPATKKTMTKAEKKEKFKAHTAKLKKMIK